ncbi:MAG: hypothetical protein U5K43_06030 [Halofilum sp. (in: g-proteobacteria)]|nr:hypothetical protein [Halofilum sp. (in: g-proteobacteria)]
MIVVIVAALGPRAGAAWSALAIPGRSSRASCVLYAWADDEHRRAVQPDPGGRHAGRRRPSSPPSSPTAKWPRARAARGLCASAAKRMALADHRLDRHDARRVPAAAVLAGHGRRVHEVPADHGHRHAAGLAGDGAGVHRRRSARAHRPRSRGRARRRRREP